MSKKQMVSGEAELQKLLQIKRLENPGKAYFDGFLTEFHRYQRADLLKEPTLLERLKAKLEDLFFFQPHKTWAMGSALAIVLLLLSVSLIQLSPRGSSSQIAESSATGDHKIQLASDSSFERDFSSPRYVTGQTPLSYDSVLAF
jgi:hypothetical protein